MESRPTVCRPLTNGIARTERIPSCDLGEERQFTVNSEDGERFIFL